MRIRIQPAVRASNHCSFLLTSFVVDGRLAVDAGSLGLADPLAELENVRDVLLTHSHIDHIGALPIFLERSYARWRKTSTVYGHRHTIEALCKDLLNGRIYPDLLNVPDAKPPFLRIEELPAEKESRIGQYSVTAVEVDHTVPCYGYLVRAENITVVFAGDSRPTRKIWGRCRELDGPIMVFVECSFPNRMEEFSILTGHLTPKLLSDELERIPGRARVVVTHIKADFYDEVVSEIRGLGSARVEIGNPDVEYEI